MNILLEELIQLVTFFKTGSLKSNLVFRNFNVFRDYDLRIIRELRGKKIIFRAPLNYNKVICNTEYKMYLHGPLRYYMGHPFTCHSTNPCVS